MSLTNLPTDNLYKFLTVTGLTLIVASSLWYYGERREAFYKSDNVRLQLKIFELEKKHLDSEMTRLRESIPSRLNIGNDYTSEKRILEDKEKEFKAKEVELTSQREALNRDIGELEACRNLAFLGIMFGIAISGMGLCLWYTKLQVYQDRLVKRESK